MKAELQLKLFKRFVPVANVVELFGPKATDYFTMFRALEYDTAEIRRVFGAVYVCGTMILRWTSNTDRRARAQAELQAAAMNTTPINIRIVIGGLGFAATVLVNSFTTEVRAAGRTALQTRIGFSVNESAEFRR